MDDAVRYPLAGAMVRAELLAGCERAPFLATALVCATLVMVLQTWLTLATGALLWLTLVAVLRYFGKEDPSMSKVYARHVRYGRYYAARSGPWAPSARHTRD